MIEVDKEVIECNSLALLGEVKTTLDRHGVTFWLDQGTLLGAVREGGLIPWDWDIDLSAWKEELDGGHPMWDDFRAAGYHVFFSKKMQSVRLEKEGQGAGWRHVEIHLYEVSGDVAYAYFYVFSPSVFQRLLYRTVQFIAAIHEIKAGPNPSYKAMVDNLEKLPGGKGTVMVPTLASGYSSPVVWAGRLLGLGVPARALVWLKNVVYQVRLLLCGRRLLVSTPPQYFINLEERELLGGWYRVPSDAEGYLEFKFGRGWRVPKRDYDFVQEDGSLRYRVEPS